MPRLERYLLRGCFDVNLTYQCAVSRRTSTNGARDDEQAVLESGEWTWQNAPRTQNKDQNLRGIPRSGAFRRRRNTLARELGGRAMLVGAGKPAQKGSHKTMPSA